MRQRHARQILRVILLTAALAIAVVAVAGDSLGLKTDKNRKHPPKLQPRLQVIEGVLHQDRVGAWVLDDKIPLRQAPELRWCEERDGTDGSPAAGRTVRLAGQWYGSVFMIRQATLVSQDRVVQRLMAPPIADPGEEIADQPR